jgi:hypothetical protein
MGKFVDLTGQVFGRLTVIEKAKQRDASGRILWRCKCNCGKETFVITNLLKKGHTKSCGCLHSDLLSERNKTHGKTYDSIYIVYRNMLVRCVDKNNKQYPNYGGRGIIVCDRWLESFENFYADMGDPPTSKHQIDRIDNNGPYSPENCRWVTAKENGRNKRTCNFISYKGEIKTLTECAEDKGMLRKTLHNRIYRSGWSIEKALETPVITPTKGQSK